MSILGKIKKKWEEWYYHDLDDDFQEEWEEAPKYNEAVMVKDRDQRAGFVLEELGKMAEASEKMEQCQDEYEAVTSLLVDMEEIDSLPKEIKHNIKEIGQKIESLEKQRHRVYSESGLMDEETLSTIERLELDIPGGIEKMEEAEEYQELIKSDLRKLDKERNSCIFRKKELNMTITNSRGIAIVIGVSMVVCIMLLIFLNVAYDMNVGIGYAIAGGTGAVALTAIYLRYIEADQELSKIMKVSNKLITLHNTVKIRYVNNTNLLQYLYMKYSVESSEELAQMWDIYNREVAARERDEELRSDLDYYYSKLNGILKKNNIKDPDIWIHQVKALYDKNEAVEVRHALIGRRQKLREQMEYNEDIAIRARDNIKRLGQRYPEYSQEIRRIVDNYEGV